jgi:hypothetical protein
MDNREGLEWILGCLILELLLVSGPGGTLNVESVDANTLRWHVEGLLNATVLASNDFFLDFGLGLDGIE